MKKIIRYLFLAAMAFTMAGTVIVSCQKGGGEEDVPEVGASKQPLIRPVITPSGNTFTIKTDGTTISSTSNGYSFEVRAGSITFKSFKCILNRNESFAFHNECNLTLSGDSTFSLLNGGKIIGSHITLSGSGSIKVIARSINDTTYNNMFSAAEGYTLTSSGKKEEEDGLKSITMTIKKSL
ncbi:MAG: hypothetical protein IJQ22_05060 [Bacteroidales bacterium]|nr:hypothetical protein [Bacteroidales bacterium]